LADLWSKGWGQPQPYTCSGGLPQHWSPVTGEPLSTTSPNDIWIGDNAWLLVALKHYRQVTNNSSYDELIQRLLDWHICLRNHTPDEGIYAGFTKDGDFIRDRRDFPPTKHPEGSIDAYGALGGMGNNAEQIRSSIKIWLTDTVWITRTPNVCFKRGILNEFDLPLDHVSWGYLALSNEYECILSYAESLHARTLALDDRHFIDTSPESPWQINPNGGCTATLSQEPYENHYTLKVTYSCPFDLLDNKWFRVYRSDIHPTVTDGFGYSFWIKGNEHGHILEAKIKNTTDETYGHSFTMTGTAWTNWKKINLPYYDLEHWWGGSNNNPLYTIQEFDFAVKNTNSPITTGELWIGSIWYRDQGVIPLPVDGFVDFESNAEKNSLWLQGTGHMATAYYVSGQTEKWKHYLDELTKVLQPAISGQGLGIPNKIGTDWDSQLPVPETEASAWYIIASQGLNPFAPRITGDTFNVGRGLSLTVASPGVLVNDWDGVSDTLTTTLVISPSHGNVILDPNGSFTYTPSSGYTGIDTFTYQVSNDLTQLGMAIVTLNIFDPITVTKQITQTNQWYDFQDVCTSLWFSDTGNVEVVTITLNYHYPSVKFDGLPRQYKITANSDVFTAQLSLCYEDSDLVAAGIPLTRQTDLRPYRYNGEDWLVVSPVVVNTDANRITATLVTDFSEWGIGTSQDHPTAVTLFSLKDVIHALPWVGILASIMVGANALVNRKKPFRE
jgi:hypothetical protein